MNKTFPDLYKALGGDKIYPVYGYAIVEDGKLVLTNGHMIVVSDFEVYADNFVMANNKVFNKELLRWMSKSDFKRIECTEEGIIAYKSGGKTETMPYSGTWAKDEKEKRVLNLFEKTYESIGSFPNWKQVIPDGSLYSESKGLSKIGLSAEYLSIVCCCFAFGSEEPHLSFEFMEEGKKNLVRITPAIEREDRFGKQNVYLTQCVLNDL